jgi:hypothetical protein
MQFIFWMNTNYILFVYDPDVAWHFLPHPETNTLLVASGFPVTSRVASIWV